MSRYLEELIEDAGGVEPLGKLIESLEAKLAKEKQEKQELQETILQLKATQSKHGEEKKDGEIRGNTGQGQGQQRRGSSSWW
jgi:hypothetical protein